MYKTINGQKLEVMNEDCYWCEKSTKNFVIQQPLNEYEDACIVGMCKRCHKVKKTKAELF